MVKLLREIFSSATDEELRIKICCKLIVAGEDEDDGVKVNKTKNAANGTGLGLEVAV